jgi:nucleotide-binding universal stress UspA family protein
MKILVGVDVEKKYESAIRLVKRLRFAQPEWHFAHVRPSVDPNLPSVLFDLEDAAATFNDDSPKLLREAGLGMSGKLHLLHGASASELMGLAEDLPADLVGLGSTGQGSLSAALLGSVGRAFAIGSPCSFLVGRGNVSETGAVRVVFATDYSPYAQQALVDFISMKADGLEEVVLLTAHEMLETSEMVEYMQLVSEAAEEGRTLREQLDHLGAQAVESLNRAGVAARIELRKGYLDSAIEHTVADCEGDLVVLGAQGHGFLERLLIGSSALNQVVTSRFSTMVIRRRAIK